MPPPIALLLGLVALAAACLTTHAVGVPPESLPFQVVQVVR